MRRVLLALVLWSAGCREQVRPPPPVTAALRLATATCEGLFPAASASKILGHPVRYREVHHRSGAYEALSCENEAHRPLEIFAFDVGCGVGARSRFVASSRAVRDTIRLSGPRVGDEAYASRNVYISWFPKRNCYTTVLMSWKRPHPDRLRALAEKVAAALPR